ncbi:MAG: entericidin A/B family lipoprotein, partial [Pseudomonadota bacterium]
MRTFLIIALLTLTACGTIEGAGQDLEDAGQAVSN